MEKHWGILRTCPLFAGIDWAELQALLECLMTVEKKYEKNQFIFRADETTTSLGVVLSGSIHIIQESYWGNRTILAHIKPGGLFCEAFSCVETEKLPVSVFAAEATEILLMNCRKMVATCSSVCSFHTQLIRNMLGILAGKNLLLTQKIAFLTQRTTQEKLLSYLSAQAQQTGSSSFEIPFNRQELAEYLSVDRSALSNELSKMQKAGLLSFHRNHFTLL